jgi:hypothetical protein
MFWDDSEVAVGAIGSAPKRAFVRGDECKCVIGLDFGHFGGVAFRS